jgi:hypothetical protein
MEAIIFEPGVSYSVACFWYGMDSATSNIVPDTLAIVRKLPEFAGFIRQKLPGEKYPDPAQNKLLVNKQNGKIQYVGDQLDLLEWKDRNVKKNFDADGDQMLGTAGYEIFGKKLLGAAVFIDDTTNNLPPFISEIKPEHIVHQNGTYLAVPGRSDMLYQTGLIEVSGDIAERGLVSFSISKNPPDSVRLGVMLDNAADFTKTGQYLWVTNSGNVSSGKVALAKSNKVPDWYFFDLKELKKGDIITIYGSVEKSSDIFTIGALTFDLMKHE